MRQEPGARQIVPTDASPSSAQPPAGPRSFVRSLLSTIGKSNRKVAAVFGSDPAHCHRAVEHLTAGAPDIPVWLFATVQPRPETAALCEAVVVRSSSLVLVMEAQRRLWQRWMALGVAPWTGERRGFPLKLAPFLIPPFRVLLQNEHGDFFAATPGKMIGHVGRRGRDRLQSSWHTLGDLARGYWKLVSYHIWRSGPVRRVKDEISGALLLALSWLFRLTGNSHRWLFRRLAASRAPALELRVDSTPPSCDVAVFRPARHVWDGGALEAFARASDARWILWLGDPAAREQTEALEPLLADPEAFGASMQTAVRAWKASLMVMAPFRALHLNEASAVLAPLANAILVDRAKLLALGIPRCSLPGAAWMMIFWKAAAAGWRSYSAGRGKSVREQSGIPVQEASVFLQVMRDPRLRGLAPRDPDLVRGNIAFSPALQKKYRPPAGRPKVLLVSPFLPYPLSHGGAVRIYNLCRALSGRVDFLLAAMRESHESVDYARLHDVFRQVFVVDRDELPSRNTSLPAQVRQYQSQSLRALVGEMAQRWKPDILQVEFTHMGAFRDAAPEVPAILVEHDLTFSLYRQLAESRPGDRAARLEYERWLAFERGALAAFDAVWTVSDDDRLAALENGARDTELTTAVPNGVDLDRFQPSAEIPGAPPEILYVGSFRHLPNFLGFEKLRTEIMPRLWRRIPEARLRVIAGPQHERYWKQFAKSSAAVAPVDPRIPIHGFHEDLRPFYTGASVVAVPLEVSAGTNIKVMEAMASGRAVVTTPIGCAGLGLVDGRDALIRGDADSFADALADLLSDPDRRSAIASRARTLVEERFGWQAIAEVAWRSYQAVRRPAQRGR